MLYRVHGADGPFGTMCDAERLTYDVQLIVVFTMHCVWFVASDLWSTLVSVECGVLRMVSKDVWWTNGGRC